MKHELQYRQGTIEDKDELMALGVASYGRFAEVLGAEHWATMEQNITNREGQANLMDKATAFVCTHKDVIVGMVFFIPSGNPTELFEAGWCYIRLLGVHPDYGGMGIGKRLTSMCMELAKSTNESIVALHTSEFQDAARHIYETIGFRKLREIGPVYGKKYWVYTMKLQEE